MVPHSPATIHRPSGETAENELLLASQDSSAGWKLKGVRVIANGNTIYNNQSINRWLEDDHRTWEDSF
jgi:hypothetical protein